MTSNQLLELGFKIKKHDGSKWYTLRAGKHTFITNDSYYNKGKDEWHIGYMDHPVAGDIFWFNNRLTEITEFCIIFKTLTGKYLHDYFNKRRSK